MYLDAVNYGCCNRARNLRLKVDRPTEGFLESRFLKMFSNNKSIGCERNNILVFQLKVYLL